MIARHCDQIGRVGGECAVPHPALVVDEGGFEEERVAGRVHGRSIWGGGETLLRCVLARSAVGDAEQVSVCGRISEDAHKFVVLVFTGRITIAFADLVGVFLGLSLIPFFDGDLCWRVVGVQIPHFCCVVCGAGG